MDKHITQFINVRGKRCGVFIAKQIDGVIRIGWAKANLKAGDKFDKQAGIGIALSRAEGRESVPALPPNLRQPMRIFQKRALAYFQNGILPVDHYQKTVAEHKTQNLDKTMSTLREQLQGAPIPVMGVGLGSKADMEQFMASMPQMMGGKAIHIEDIIGNIGHTIEAIIESLPDEFKQ